MSDAVNYLYASDRRLNDAQRKILKDMLKKCKSHDLFTKTHAFFEDKHEEDLKTLNAWGFISVPDNGLAVLTSLGAMVAAYQTHCDFERSD